MTEPTPGRNNGHRPVRIGMLTPSSNTVLEPYTCSMLSVFGDDASAHFARFRVKEISVSEAARAQFTDEPILDAARHLADAKCDVIAWNGTSAGWLGFEADERLCRSIRAETGILATSTILTLNRILAATGVKTMGLVTPYLSEVQDRIIRNYGDIGVEVIADRRLEERDNFSFAEHPPSTAERMIRDVARSGPDAIAVICTNFRGAPVVARLEEDLGITILDSVAITVWGTAAMAGLEVARIKGWGRVFQDLAPGAARDGTLVPAPAAASQ